MADMGQYGITISASNLPMAVQGYVEGQAVVDNGVPIYRKATLLTAAFFYLFEMICGLASTQFSPAKKARTLAKASPK